MFSHSFQYYLFWNIYASFSVIFHIIALSFHILLVIHKLVLFDIGHCIELTIFWFVLILMLSFIHSFIDAVAAHHFISLPDIVFEHIFLFSLSINDFDVHLQCYCYLHCLFVRLIIKIACAIGIDSILHSFIQESKTWPNDWMKDYSIKWYPSSRIPIRWYWK